MENQAQKEEWIIACPVSVTVWGFYDDKEAAIKALPDVLLKQKEEAASYRKNHVEFEHRIPDYWLKQAEKAEQSAYQVMTYSDYNNLERRKYLDKPLERIDYQAWEDALNVLPPLKWGLNRGLVSFFMSEFYSGSFTYQYAELAGDRYRKIVDYRDSSTWISCEMIQKAGV